MPQPQTMLMLLTTALAGAIGCAGLTRSMLMTTTIIMQRSRAGRPRAT